jgi:hypothetical protein
MLGRTGWEEYNKLRVVIDFNGGCEGIKLLFQHLLRIMRNVTEHYIEESR